MSIFSISINDLPESSHNDSFAPIPAGEYTAQVVSAEVKSTKSGDGQYIKLRWDITGPTHQGRVVFQNLNVKNQSQKAEELGRAELRSLMLAAGLQSIQDTDQLIGAIATIKVKIRPAENGYEASNDVAKIMPPSSVHTVSSTKAATPAAFFAAPSPAATLAAPPPFPPMASTTQQQPPAASNKAPWQR